MPGKLVSWIDGEPWFDNPLLVTATANPRRKRKKMAASNPRRKRARRNPSRRSRARARRNPIAANPRHGRRRRRSGYRHNPPAVMGISLPPVEDVLYTSVGFIAPAALSGQILNLLPDSMRGQATTWIVKAAAAIVPAALAKRFLGPRAASLMLVGGGCSFTLDLLRTYAPGVIPGLSGMPMLGYWTPQALPAPQQQLPAAAASRLVQFVTPAAPDRFASRF